MQSDAPQTSAHLQWLHSAARARASCWQPLQCAVRTIICETARVQAELLPFYRSSLTASVAVESELVRARQRLQAAEAEQTRHAVLGAAGGAALGCCISVFMSRKAAARRTH